MPYLPRLTSGSGTLEEHWALTIPIPPRLSSRAGPSKGGVKLLLYRDMSLNWTGFICHCTGRTRFCCTVRERFFRGGVVTNTIVLRCTERARRNTSSICFRPSTWMEVVCVDTRHHSNIAHNRINGVCCPQQTVQCFESSKASSIA